MGKQIDTSDVLLIAKAAGRHNAFRWSVDNYVIGGKRIGRMAAERDYFGRTRFADASTRDVVNHSAGRLTLPRARYHLKKLAAAGRLTAECSPNWTRYRFATADVDAWFAEALEFYLRFGLSVTEIRHVELPPIPDKPAVAIALPGTHGEVSHG